MWRGIPPRRRGLSGCRETKVALWTIGAKAPGMNRGRTRQGKITFPHSLLPAFGAQCRSFQFEGLLNFASSIATLFLTSESFMTMVIAALTCFNVCAIL